MCIKHYKFRESAQYEIWFWGGLSECSQVLDRKPYILIGQVLRGELEIGTFRAKWSFVLSGYLVV